MRKDRFPPKPIGTACVSTGPKRAPCRFRARLLAIGLAGSAILFPVDRLRAAGDVLPPIKGLGFELGRLEARSRAAGHPWLFYAPDEVDRARQRMKNDPEARKVFERFKATADEQLKVAIRPIDESWWEAVKDKPWADTYPEVFAHTLTEPHVYGHAADTLATAWLLIGDDRYAEQAIAMLMNLTSYSFRAEHYDVGMNYAVWGYRALRTYDVLFGRLSPEQRGAIDAFMTRLAWAVARNDVYWIENNVGGGLNNHLAWHKAMLGWLGLFYDWPGMVEYAMKGRRGMISLLEDGLLDQGLWAESSLTYQFAAIVPMLGLGDCQRRAGYRPALLDVTGANGRTLKQGWDAMFDVLSADGMIPPIGDAYGARTRLWQIPAYEQAWSAWGDAKYAWLLRHNAARSIESLFVPPLPAGTLPPPIRTLLLPEHGYAFLRSQADVAYWDSDAWCAFLTYDRSNVHANADKLSVMLFGQKRLLLADVEGRATVPHAFSAKIQKELNRGALSQNTVMVDGQDQRCGPRMLRLVEFHDVPGEKRVTAADEEGLLYEGVRQMRTLVMGPDYVLDVFQVDSAKSSRQFDWVAHVMDDAACDPEELNPRLRSMCQPFAFPSNGAWPWLRQGRSFVGSDPIELEWRDKESRLRLKMINPPCERVILCGYPASDKPDSGRIPMVIVRCRASHATFAALWLIGDHPRDAQVKLLPPRQDRLVYEVVADGRAREHLVPLLPAGKTGD